MILAAPRRFGKTSVMYRLIDGPRWDYKVVHCDVEAFTDPSDLITALVVQFAKNDSLSKAARALSFVPSTLWKGLRTSVEEVEILKFKLKLREQVRQQWQASGEELFRAIAETAHNVVLILDEFAVMIDRMSRVPEMREEARTLLHWLRHLRQTPATGNVRFLIAGSVGINHVLNQLGEIASINDFEQLRIEPFPPDVADHFLSALSSAHQVPLSPAIRKRICGQVGTLVPYFLQIMFSEIHKAYAHQGIAPTSSSVETIYREKVLGVDCKTYFDHYYGRLRDYYPRAEESAAKSILRELGLAGALSPQECFRLYRESVHGGHVENFNGLMANLDNDFYVCLDPKGGKYRFASKLLRDWWLRHYGMEA